MCVWNNCILSGFVQKVLVFCQGNCVCIGQENTHIGSRSLYNPKKVQLKLNHAKIVKKAIYTYRQYNSRCHLYCTWQQYADKKKICLKKTHTAHMHTAHMHTAYQHTAHMHTAYLHTAHMHTAYLNTPAFTSNFRKLRFQD